MDKLVTQTDPTATTTTEPADDVHASPRTAPPHARTRRSVRFTTPTKPYVPEEDPRRNSTEQRNKEHNPTRAIKRVRKKRKVIATTDPKPAASTPEALNALRVKRRQHQKKRARVSDPAYTKHLQAEVSAAKTATPNGDSTPPTRLKPTALDTNRFEIELADPNTPFRISEACAHRTQFSLTLAIIDCDDFRDLLTVTQARRGIVPTDGSRATEARTIAQTIFNSLLPKDATIVKSLL